MSLFGNETEQLLPYDLGATYVPWVLGDLDSDAIFTQLLNESPWLSQKITVFGKTYDEPRRVAWHGDIDAHYSYSGITMKLNPWTPLLQQLREICEQHAEHSFNSVLVNLYRNGQDKNGWHSDNEPELGTEPTIASLSLGASRRFKFRHRETKEVVERALENGSLVVMSGLSQKNWEHEIPRQAAVTEPRINLTFRYVHPK
jgi:alkylated DNA repair dioxygenase AlkB